MRLPRFGKMRSAILLTLLQSVLACLPSAATASDPLTIGGSGSAIAVMRLLAAAYTVDHADSAITVLPSLGSTGGIRGVLTGTIDIGITARPLSQDEISSGAREIPFVKTAFVFVTARPAPARTLSLADLSRIYSSLQTAWSDGRPIRVVLRPVTDSTTIILRQILPELDQGLQTLHARMGIPTAITDQDAMDFAERLPGSLTVTSLLAVLSEDRHLDVLPIEGVAPTAEHIADGSYRLSQTIAAVTGPDPSPPVRTFLEFLRSEQSAGLLRRHGGVPLSPPSSTSLLD